MKARMSQLSRGKYFVYLSLWDPQSEKSCGIPLISVKLPKCMYSLSLFQSDLCFSWKTL